MSESFDKTLNLLKDLNLEDFSKHSFRGIEKESLRVSNKTISTTDHPVSLGSTLTLPMNSLLLIFLKHCLN